MLTIAAIATAAWLLIAAALVVAVHRVTSKPFPSQDCTGPEEFVFDIEEYQWQDVA